jgi:hypothetical protein
VVRDPHWDFRSGGRPAAQGISAENYRHPEKEKTKKDMSAFYLEMAAAYNAQQEEELAPVRAELETIWKPLIRQASQDKKHVCFCPIPKDWQPRRRLAPFADWVSKETDFAGFRVLIVQATNIDGIATYHCQVEWPWPPSTGDGNFD